MGVISQISVGDVMYYQVDDIPSHTAPKGSVAMMMSSTTYSNGFTYVNNDGGTTWLKCITPSYGKMHLSDATNTVDFASQTPGSWYSFNPSPGGTSWTLDPDSSSDWELATEDANTDDLKYTGSTTMRVAASNSSTFRGGPSKWMGWEVGIAANFTIPTYGWNDCYTEDNGATTNAESMRVLEMTTDDYLLSGLSPISREGGGGPTARAYIAKHSQVIGIKLDEPLVLAEETTIISEDWESNSFSAWTVVNDTTNQWEIGTAQVDTGTYGAYGSNDGGTTANYSQAGDVSHFYQDVTFPSDVNITLTFVWRSFMENAGAATQYDYGTVNIIDTTTTPVAGTEVSTALADGAGGNGRVNQTGANNGKFNEGYRYGGGTYDGTWFTETIDLSAFAGTTKRLVFSFKDDNAAPEDAPAMSIDNILLTYGGGLVY
jgi:hypothetical protein